VMRIYRKFKTQRSTEEESSVEMKKDTRNIKRRRGTGLPVPL
jgi:hypothetical protein